MTTISIDFITKRLFPTPASQAALMEKIAEASSFKEALQITLFHCNTSESQQILAPFLRAATIKHMREAPSDWSKEEREKNILEAGIKRLLEIWEKQSLTPAEIDANRNLIITLGESLYNQYLSKQALDREWAEDPEARNLADLLEVTLYITSKKSNEEEYTYSARTLSEDKPIIILYCNEVHWFIDPDNPLNTLGDGNCLYNAFAQMLHQLVAHEHNSTNKIKLRTTDKLKFTDETKFTTDRYKLKFTDGTEFNSDNRHEYPNIIKPVVEEPVESPSLETQIRRDRLLRDPDHLVELFCMTSLHDFIEIAEECIKTAQVRPDLLKKMLLSNHDALAAIFCMTCESGHIEMTKVLIKVAKTDTAALENMLLAGKHHKLAEGFLLACQYGHTKIVKACIQAAQSNVALLRGLISTCLVYAKEQPQILRWLLFAGLPNDKLTIDLANAFERNDKQKIRDCVEVALSEAQNICKNILETQLTAQKIGFFTDSSALVKREQMSLSLVESSTISASLN